MDKIGLSMENGFAKVVHHLIRQEMASIASVALFGRPLQQEQ